MQEIIITNKKNNKRIMLVENGELIEQYQEEEQHTRLEGNIYLGKIRNILPGMQAAFVDIGEGKNTFIQVKDLLKKEDETKGITTQTKDIKEVAKIGMNIIVQVKKDANHKKGARVSTHISLPGKYMVYMPDTDFITISQKITDETQKQELKQYLKQILPQGSGAILRTSAIIATKEQLKEDAETLQNKWKQIKNQAQNNNEICKLYESENVIEKLIQDTIANKIEKITVDTEKDYKEVEKILAKHQEYSKIKLEKVQDSTDKYTLKKQIEQLDNRKIWLKCGGFITIDKTEALTAIDVNSGKYTGKMSQEQTIYTVNKEATEEIAKQLRLRDIDGIIIIDYIDMQKEQSREKIKELLQENLKKDRSKTQILEFTKLNLLELTRKHMFSKINK